MSPIVDFYKWLQYQVSVRLLFQFFCRDRVEKWECKLSANDSIQIRRMRKTLDMLLCAYFLCDCVHVCKELQSRNLNSLSRSFFFEKKTDIWKLAFGAHPSLHIKFYIKMKFIFDFFICQNELKFDLEICFTETAFSLSLYVAVAFFPVLSAMAGQIHWL